MDRICPFCNTLPVSKHRGVIGVTCASPECLAEYIRQKHACMYEVVTAEGLCRLCKKVPVTEGGICIPCKNKNKERYEKHKERLKKGGKMQISIDMPVALMYGFDNKAYSNDKTRQEAMEEAFLDYILKK